MAFSQQRFLNSTIVGYTESLGWGGEPSQLVVSLVNDDYIGDNFTPGNVNRPVTFAFGNHSYTGILQSYEEKIDTGSGQGFEVVITGPNAILDGTPLILDGYTGAVSSYNILNVYGYLESFGFGSSQKNETGIPWKFIRDAIQAMTEAPQQGDFGGPLYFLSSRYIVDLRQLPDLPDDFRVGSDQTTILQFIDEVCSAGGCDYFINMIEVSTGIFVIKVNTVSRRMNINYGAVSQFLSTIPEYESKSFGIEASNETTTKFLVGGPLREMWYQYSDYSLATVWPFWGFDITGNPIIGTGIGNNHQFTLDTRTVNNPRVPPFYTTNIGEIRAVLEGRANWETYLCLQNGMGGIHSNKAVQLGIIGYTANQTGQTILDELVQSYQGSSTNTIELDPLKAFFPHTEAGHKDYEQLDIETGYLYDFLYQIATEYYGKKFMVNIPYTYSAVEPDTLKIRLSQLPVDSGFLDEDLWPVAMQRNLLPIDVDRFSEEDGKIVCYVRYDNGDFLDLSDIPVDSVGLNSRNPGYGQHKLQNYAIFVKASVSENVVFLDNATKFGPRAVITLDGAVFERVVQDEMKGKQILIDFINEGFSGAGIDINTPTYKTNVIDKIVNHIGNDLLNYSNASRAVIPNLAVIPLESQTQNYGPWYANGIPGKVEYENDDSLVPWNYGGFEAMNIAASAKVESAISLNQQIERGSVVFPDAPAHSLGQQIGIGGPLITDISVSIDATGGAHTTYNFKRTVKRPRYGQASADRVAQLSRTMQVVRRNMRLNALPKRSRDVSLTSKPISVFTKQAHPKKRLNSSHEMMVGQVFTDNDGNTTSSVFLQSAYNFQGHVANDYINKAYTSLDGLFVPFSTKEHDLFPSFSLPASGAETPTVDDLTPFPSGEVPIFAKMMGRDYESGATLYSPSDSGNYRGIALKGPLIVSGPCYNTEDARVGEIRDMSTWKTGPVDLRWDDDRAVYAAGSAGNGLIRATMTSTTRANLLTAGTNVAVTNWLGSSIGSGDRVFLMKDSGEYVIVNQKYYSLSSISSFGCNSDGSTSTCTTTYKIPSRPIRSGPSGCPQD